MYTTIVKLGSPPKEYIVLIDTGSDLLWVSCNTCDNCPRSNGLGFKFNFFDTINSSTAALIYCWNRLCPFEVQGVDVRCHPPVKQCTYPYGYQDNITTSGVYVTDELHFDMILGHPSPSSVNSSTIVFFGMYTTIVKLRTPSKEYIVLIDTGCDLFWVSCNTCDNCPRSNGLGFKFNFFDTINSATIALIYCWNRLCPFEVQTAIKVATATTLICNATTFCVASDHRHATWLHDCGRDGPDDYNGGLIETPTVFDGIFGIEPGPLSVVSQLSAREIILNAFSHCLKRYGNGGGILALGVVVEPRIVYSPLAPSKYVLFSTVFLIFFL
ncbi:aspartic proteinase 36-like [Cicer arietinum]|uniref:aspartic proteinase 36-like n=1 Tax=Cicer arietinum TaxID=3827 RepID=UPI003CC6DD35